MAFMHPRYRSAAMAFPSSLGHTKPHPLSICLVEPRQADLAEDGRKWMVSLLASPCTQRLLRFASSTAAEEGTPNGSLSSSAGFATKYMRTYIRLTHLFVPPSQG